MAEIVVTGNQLTFNGKTYRCTIGKGGFSSHKKEGDGATPIGTFALRECWYRADRISKPETKLPLRVIEQNDGWCDDPQNKDYNKHVKRHPGEGRDPRQAMSKNVDVDASLRWHDSERLWRDDHCYDLIVPLGYNDGPVVPGMGSAIFLHVMHDSGRATEGCVALAKEDFLELLPDLSVKTRIKIG